MTTHSLFDQCPHARLQDNITRAAHERGPWAVSVCNRSTNELPNKDTNPWDAILSLFSHRMPSKRLPILVPEGSAAYTSAL